MVKKVLFVIILLRLFTGEAHASTFYEVKKGDTLSKIAKIHKVTVKDIKAWNKLTKDSIYIKQRLIVQNPKGKVATTPATSKPVTKQDPPPKKEFNAEAPLVVPSLSTEGQATYNLLIDFAYSLEGIPYSFGGNTMEGFDCSGFIYFIHSQAGLDITRKGSDNYFTETLQIADPVPGDLVFFQNTYKEGISHMGIYLGENKFMHAGSKGVEIASLDLAYWKDRFVSFNRFQQIR